MSRLNTICITKLKQLNKSNYKGLLNWVKLKDRKLDVLGLNSNKREKLI